MTEVVTTLLNTLLNDQKAARLQKENKDPVKISLLTTLYSEAVNVGKNKGNRPSTDEEVLAVIKKFVKGVTENIDIYTKNQAVEALDKAKKELVILQNYLPATVGSQEIEAYASSVILEEKLDKKDGQTFGKVMKGLKAKFGSSLDGAVASKVLKDFLAKPTE